jgi:hypothetical protein
MNDNVLYHSRVELASGRHLGVLLRNRAFPVGNRLAISRRTSFWNSILDDERDRNCFRNELSLGGIFVPRKCPLEALVDYRLRCKSYFLSKQRAARPGKAIRLEASASEYQFERLTPRLGSSGS